MMMDTTINQRFSDVIKMCIESNLVTNKADFGDKIGVKPSRISEILGERMGVSSEICRDICRLFDINLNWLIANEGEMLRKNEVVAQKSENKNNLTEDNINLLLTMLKEKDDELMKLRAENDDLKEQLRDVPARKRSINLDDNSQSMDESSVV
jgi:plasmid maintenance system antidote protein VapI